MAHDHFGYYLGFGSVAILPTVYTIQAQYLGRYPVDLPTSQVIGILAVGLVGYIIFRGANDQKDVVRMTGGKCNVWGKPAEFIRAGYKTSNGQEHESLLLTSGGFRSPPPPSYPFFSYFISEDGAFVYHPHGGEIS
jgi:7-dehydrocholesterol reductase